MEVITTEKKTVSLGEIRLGECFKFEGELYIKINTIKGGLREYNAVCLSSGTPAGILISEEVTRSNAKIIEED